MPLLVAEAATVAAQGLLAEDPVQIVWWSSEVECISAISRMERDGSLTAASSDVAVSRLDALKDGWHEMQPSEQIRRVARRLLAVHPLRAADALQLAAAVTASEGAPASLGFISFDDRLIGAARKEGLSIISPA